MKERMRNIPSSPHRNNFSTTSAITPSGHRGYTAAPPDADDEQCQRRSQPHGAIVMLLTHLQVEDFAT